MNIHIARNGQKIGTFDLDKLKKMASENQILKTDHAFLSVNNEWKCISEIKELNDVLFPDKSFDDIPPPPPPAPPSTTQFPSSSNQAQQIQQPEKVSKTKQIISVVILIALAGWFLSFLVSDKTIKSEVASLNQNKEWNEKINGGIENLKVKIDKDKGAVKIDFDYDSGKEIVYKNIPRSFLVRLFDKNGKYITHFTTKERFVENDAEYPYKVYRISPSNNHLEYQIPTRDAEFVEMAEFGFDIN